MGTVLLINPPGVFKDDSEKANLRNYKIGGGVKSGVWPPLGLMYLAGELRKEKINTTILDAFVQEYSLDQTLTHVRSKNPRVVGISAATPQIRGAFQLATEIKKQFGQKISVCLGGPHVSSDPGFMEHAKCFDFAILGEAEKVFPGIVKTVINGRKVPRIIRATPPEDLDAIVIPDRSDFLVDDYFKTESPCFTIMTSRGCPFQCIFCSRAAISDRVRYRNPEAVLDEIGQCLGKWGRTIVFLDDTFGLNRAHTEQILNGIIKRGYRLRWTCNTRANLIDREYIDLMKRSGCYMLLFGVESGSEEIRNEVLRKNVSDSAIQNAVDLCREFKIMSGLYFMLGFPGETRADMIKTVSFGKKMGTDLITVHPTAIYPGSRLQRMLLEEKGIDMNEYWTAYAQGELSFEDVPSVYIPEGMSLRDIQFARRRSYFKFFFRPSVIWSHFRNDIGSIKDLRRDVAIALNLLLRGRTSKDLK